MSEVIEQESTELVTLPPKESALAVYSTSGGLDPLIEQIRDKVAGTVYDISTRKGRDECASDAFKVAKSKAAIERLGKALSAEYKEIPKKIDAERKRAFEALEALQKEVRQPLTEWEEAEERRKAKHEMAIQKIKLRIDCRDLDIPETRQNIEWLSGLSIDESWEEYETEAHQVKDRALIQLRVHLEDCEKREADLAELVRLKAESEARRIQDEKERIAREAAAAATKEAEAKAQTERAAATKAAADAKAAADRRELELKLKAETAERERLETIQKAEKEKADAIARAEQEKRDAEERQRQAVETERKRQADEAARIEAEVKAREADKAHKGRINRAALAAFISGGMPDECAKLAVTMIAKGEIPAIRISY